VKEFLKRIHLIEYLTIDIEVQKSDFVSKFKQHVDNGSTGIFSDTLDIFSSGKNEYKGFVEYDRFKIKRKRKFFDVNSGMAVASGTYLQNGKKLIIETEINGFNSIMIPFYVFLIVFYSIFIGIFITNDTIQENGAAGFVFPFLFIHAVFMLGIPYFIMRRSIKRMKHELEREFYYLTKK